MYLFLYSLLIYAINLTHFFVYYYLSSYNFSIYNLLFTLIFSAFLIWLITLSAKLYWKIFNFIFLLILSSIYLINYLYFSIFQNFFNPFENLNFFQPSSANFFWQYITDIPIPIYLINIFWLFSLSLLIFIYKPPYLKKIYIKFCSRRQNITNIKDKKIYYLLHSIIVLILIITSTLSYNYFLIQNPNPNWWNKSQQQQDFTIWGSITHEQLFQPANDLFETKEIAAASPTINIEEIQTNSKTKSDTTTATTINPTDPQINNKPQKTKQINLDNLNNLEKSKYWQNLISKQKHQILKFTQPETPNFTENPHIIILQLESVPSWAVELNPSPMPFLKELIQNNYSVEKFFANSCQTINAELSTLCSSYAHSDGAISKTHLDNDYKCLPTILKNEFNYKNHFYHANDPTFWERNILTPKFGFNNLHFAPELNIRQPDYTVLETMAKNIAQSQNNTFNYFVSFTSHSPHKEHYLNIYNNNTPENENISIQKYPLPQNILNNIELKPDEIHQYLSLLTAVDNSLKHFFQLLEEYNLKNKSLILIHSDHRYYNFFPADKIENFYNYNELPMVLITPQNQNNILQNIASHIDLAPTILDLLNYPKESWPSHFMGKSLFNQDFPNIALNKCLKEINYIDKNLIIKGNTQNQMYQKFTEFKNNIDLTQYYKILQNLVSETDLSLDQNLLK